MKLPNAQNAHIDLRKLAGYALANTHPEGRHKARVFLSALGLTATDAEWLAQAILAVLPNAEADLLTATAWGTLYRVDMEISRGRRCAKVRTGWLCTGAEAKLVTCFVIGGCGETA